MFFFFLKRLASGIIPYSADQSINIDYCGESQGCLIVPQQCNNDAKCDYALSWQVIDDDTAKFHMVARAKGFTGVGFSTDERRVRPSKSYVDKRIHLIIDINRIF